MAFFFDSLSMGHQDAPETSVLLYQSTWRQSQETDTSRQLLAKLRFFHFNIHIKYLHQFLLILHLFSTVHSEDLRRFPINTKFSLIQVLVWASFTLS